MAALQLLLEQLSSSSSASALAATKRPQINITKKVTPKVSMATLVSQQHIVWCNHAMHAAVMHDYRPTDSSN